MLSKFSRFKWQAAVVLCAAGSSWAAAEQGCEALARTVRAEVIARPARVLIVVEDAMVQNELCACEVVKAAIAAAKADGKMVGQIVFTAITSAPGLATAIAECALATAPGADAEVKAALHRAMATGPAPTSQAPAPAPVIAENLPDAKAPASKAAATTTPEQVPGGSPVEIGGIYLIFPGGGAVAGGPVPKNVKIMRPPRPPKARIILRPVDVSPGASDDPP